MTSEQEGGNYEVLYSDDDYVSSNGTFEWMENGCKDILEVLYGFRYKQKSFKCLQEIIDHWKSKFDTMYEN